ncbi:hypothetical protein [Christiangramia crocea]|uniref:Uncharacterized protein n=1 Tax=Christiangramia crocea TaxID=2904124 RepID=A0A9X1UZ23_9FLAO|nr:hypothetical protein [Gramella crocea]MCG9972760.1 hypothetical protein [Gramella crocea]
MSNSKVIDLKVKKGYSNRLDKIVDKLEAFDKVVFGSMIELTTSDKVK